MDLLSTLYGVAEIVVPIGAIPFVARHHRPHVAIGWLVLIAFLPVLGLAAYVHFGWLRLRNRRGELDAVARALDPARDAIIERFQGDDPSGDAEGEVRRLTHRIGWRRASTPLRGNRVQVLETDAFIDALLRDIESAEESAELLYYLFVDDGVGRRVAAALGAAARRGVRCRLLVGSISAWLEGGRSAFRELAAELEEAGVEVAPLRPLNPVRDRIERIDLRNHRKIAVLDGRVAYVGSQNIHEADSGLEDGAWVQLNARIEGPAAAMLRSLFLADLYLERGVPDAVADIAPPREAGDALVQVIGSRHTGRASELRRVFVGAIHQARSRLTICSPYFVPDEATLLALGIASQRGVDVRLILPEKSDKWYVDATARAFFDEIVPDGIRVFLHGQGTLHTKAMLLDDELAYVGSGNFDRRSMFLDDELGVLLSDADSIDAIRATFERYVDESRLIDPVAWADRSKVQQYVDHCCKLLSPML